MDHRTFGGFIKLISDPALDFDEAVKQITLLRTVHLPEAMADLRAKYRFPDLDRLITGLTGGCKYWLGAFDKVVAASTRADIKDLIRDYVAVPVTQAPEVKSKYHMVQALMKCTMNQARAKLLKLEREADPDAEWHSLLTDVAREKGYNTVDDLLRAID